jgi:hypothetical protein
MLRLGAAGGLVAVFVLPLQAQAVELGGLTVPTVPVKPPPLPVPTVPTVTPPPVPTVTLKAPPPPAPPLPVKAPTVTTPTVTVPTVKVPTVKAPAPPPPVKSVPLPTVSVPTVSVRTSPLPAVKAPSGLPGPAASSPTQPGDPSTGPTSSRATSTAGSAAAASGAAGPAYNATALTLPVFAQGLAARHRTRALTAMIRRYQACLAELPAPMGTLLALRAGLNRPQALSAARTAAYLHVSRAGYARLERQAVERLRTAAQKGCGTSAAPSGAAGGSGPWAKPGGPSSLGGVLDARYAKLAPAKAAASTGGASTNLFGLSLSPAARDSLLAAFLACGGGALVFAFLFLDGVGIGPRHPRWRRRLRRRLAIRGPGGHSSDGTLRRRV